MFTLTGLVGVCDPKHNILDHSLLTSSYNHSDNNENNNGASQSVTYVKEKRYDVINILCTLPVLLFDGPLISQFNLVLEQSNWWCDSANTSLSGLGSSTVLVLGTCT